jgi:succinoglycan biosynthesis transport protein ExoP
MRRVVASILNELQRLREVYKSDYEFAHQTEGLINKEIQGAIVESQSSNEAMVKLADLETSAATYKTLYDNFVRRYSEATEQQSFPYTEVRVVTPAMPPIKRGDTYRKRLLIVAAMPFIGLAFGIGLGALLDFFDRGFRTSSQVEAMLGLACIELVPLQGKANKPENQHPPTTVGPESRLISSKLGIVSSVIEQPFSRFSEAIRTIKLAADLNGISANRVVGITSAAPDEGKSTIAAALAVSIAQVGKRVVLIDCDLRNPSLSRAIAPNSDVGILEVLSGKAALDDALIKEAYLSMAFLPVPSKSRIADSSELLSSSAAKKLFEGLRHGYDYVIVDLPPLAPIVDVQLKRGEKTV